MLRLVFSPVGRAQYSLIKVWPKETRADLTRGTGIELNARYGTHVRRPYRLVTLLALLAAVAQVTLGGVVRVTGSGDACPDWPLCHGQLVPPLDYHTLLEYSHRLSATVLGVLVLSATILAWRSLRRSKTALVSTTVATLLVIAAAVLGGLTVLSELSWWVRLIHLGLAELVVAAIAVAWLAGDPDYASRFSAVVGGPAQRYARPLAWATLGGLLTLILYGSYMVGANYGASCTSWPMCQGLRIPDATAFVVNMGHRGMTLIVAVLVVQSCAGAWRRGADNPKLRWFAILTSGLLAAAVLVGALTVWLDFSALARSLHLTSATLVWASAVLMIAAVIAPDRSASNAGLMCG